MLGDTEIVGLSRYADMMREYIRRGDLGVSVKLKRSKSEFRWIEAQNWTDDPVTIKIMVERISLTPIRRGVRRGGRRRLLV